MAPLLTRCDEVRGGVDTPFIYAYQFTKERTLLEYDSTND